MERLTLDHLPREVLAKLDLETTFMASRLVIAAERLQVFRKLQDKKLSTDRIESILNIHPRYLTFFLNALVSLGLLHKKDDVYWNSNLTKKYFIEERSIYWTRQFSAESVENFGRFAILEKVLVSGKDYREVMKKKSQSYIEEFHKDPQRAEDFTYMLYYYHQQDAQALTQHLDLRNFRKVLDVGGGSGVMSIALVKQYPHLCASILEIEPVCKTAQQIIHQQGLTKHINTIVGNMNEDLPVGYDVIMFCDIGSVAENLLKKAYDRLPENGMVVLVDRYLSQERTDPLDSILHQFIGSSFPIETHEEMVNRLQICGFRNILKKNIYKDVWMITGRK